MPPNRRPALASLAAISSASLLLIAPVLSCSEDIEVGADHANLGGMPDATVPDGSPGGAGSGAGGASGQGGTNEGGACAAAAVCPGHAYACSDCIDNDSDGFVDLEDPDCLGPCQSAEDNFFGSVSVQNQGRCAQDCYFDDDAGFGNDDCSWSHHCDMLAMPPDYPPGGEECAYAPEEPIQSASGVSCATAEIEQSAACLETCLPLTPAGCDCFGCCVIEGAPGPIWIGSNDGNTPTCNLSTLADEALCRPCTQVESCRVPAL